MDKLQELLNNLGNVFVEKEPVRKKFLSIEKNVSLFYSLIGSLKICMTWSWKARR